MVFSFADRYKSDGRIEIMDRLEKLQKEGYTFDEAMRIVKDENVQIETFLEH